MSGKILICKVLITYYFIKLRLEELSSVHSLSLLYTPTLVSLFLLSCIVPEAVARVIQGNEAK